MRIMQRGRVNVTLRDTVIRAAVRPVSGLLTARRCGEYVQDMLRLLLPCDTVLSPGEKMEIGGAPYVCVSVRALSGHLQADARRCSR